jgi:hypothetical protein
MFLQKMGARDVSEWISSFVRFADIAIPAHRKGANSKGIED